MTLYESKRNYVDSLVREAIASGNQTDAALAEAAEDAFEVWKGVTPLDEALREV